MKLIKEELGEVATKDTEIDRLRKKVEKLKCNSSVKERLYNEINRYESIPSMSPELNITKDYIDWLLNLPWAKFTKDNDDLKSGDLVNHDSYGSGVVISIDGNSDSGSAWRWRCLPWSPSRKGCPCPQVPDEAGCSSRSDRCWP